MSPGFKLNVSSLALDFFEFQYIGKKEYPLHVKHHDIVYFSVTTGKCLVANTSSGKLKIKINEAYRIQTVSS